MQHFTFSFGSPYVLKFSQLLTFQSNLLLKSSGNILFRCSPRTLVAAAWRRDVFLMPLSMIFWLPVKCSRKYKVHLIQKLMIEFNKVIKLGEVFKISRPVIKYLSNYDQNFCNKVKTIAQTFFYPAQPKIGFRHSSCTWHRHYKTAPEKLRIHWLLWKLTGCRAVLASLEPYQCWLAGVQDFKTTSGDLMGNHTDRWRTEWQSGPLYKHRCNKTIK